MKKAKFMVINKTVHYGITINKKDEITGNNYVISITGTG